MANLILEKMDMVDSILNFQHFSSFRDGENKMLKIRLIFP
ncbi:hypothetical protein GQ41_0822 [Arenibacter algicola]|uniref:Transposase n=1 Tax=Arenibacter algicola TaxID=616991 RepID=A0ABY3A7L0_9FLAO